MNGYGSAMDASPPVFWEAVSHKHGLLLHRKIMWWNRYSATGCSPTLQAVDSKQAENLSVGETKSYWTNNSCQALAGAGHSSHHRFDHLGDDMKLADLMSHLPQNLPERFRIERRAIGRDAEKGQGACRQGRVQTPQKRPDVVVRGIVIQDVIEETLVAAIIDCRKN
jgi:hypothetical protein